MPSKHLHSAIGTNSYPKQFSPIITAPFVAGLPKPDELRRSLQDGKITQVKAMLHQIQHLERVKTILENNYFSLDVSDPGWGKTEISTRIAMDALKRGEISRVIVVCDKTPKSNWARMSTTYSLPLVNLNGPTCTYQFMSGKHCPLLDQSQVKDGKVVKNIYKPTETLRQICEEGVYFIFDEFYKFANANNCSVAGKAILEVIRSQFNNGGKSRALLLSATPLNKIEHFWNIMQVLGIVQNKKVLQKNRGKISVQDLGFSQFIDFFFDILCKSTSYRNYTAITEAFDELFEENDIFINDDGIIPDQMSVMDTHSTKDFLFELFSRCLLPLIGSKMKSPRINVDLDAKNGFYPISSSEAVRLGKAVDKLGDAYRRQEEESDNNQLGAIQAAMVEIEHAKIPLFKRIIRKELEAEPNRKVVFAVNYLETLSEIADEFAKYNPVSVQGSDSDDARSQNIAKFNEPNGNCRLIIFTIPVGSHGISLHDIYGDFPRTLYISPTYSFEKMTQTVYRIYRYGSKSDARVRLVFATNSAEKGILANLFSKQKIHRAATILDDDEDDKVFPGGYQDEVYK